MLQPLHQALSSSSGGLGVVQHKVNSAGQIVCQAGDIPANLSFYDDLDRMVDARYAQSDVCLEDEAHWLEGRETGVGSSEPQREEAALEKVEHEQHGIEVVQDLAHLSEGV